MKKSQRMQRMIELNRNLEEISCNAYTRTQHLFEQQLDKLEQLKVYRSEYNERLRLRCRDNVTPGEIIDYRYFFNSLDEAIRAQQQLVDQVHRETEMQRAAWLEKKQENDRLESLAATLRSRDAEADRKQQDETLRDEFMARLPVARAGHELH